MTEPMKYCEFCGSELASGAHFCEACGQPVRKPSPVEASPVDPKPPVESFTTEATPPVPSPEPPPAPVYEPPASYTPVPHYVPKADLPKRRSITPVVLGVVGCLSILCIALIVVVIVLSLRAGSTVSDLSNLTLSDSSVLPVPTSKPSATRALLATKAPLPTQPPVPAQDPLPTNIPLSTQESAPLGSWSADIGQMLDGSYFSDDFSSAAYEWADVQDETRLWGIQDGHYAMHLFESEYSIWAYLPIEFRPTTIGFEAAVQPGSDQGAYGVICHYQDENNYHFVSIDPLNKEYSIGYLLNDEYETLLEDMWMPSVALNESPYAVNNVLIACDPDMITLMINNEVEALANTMANIPGDTAIYGETWEDTPAEGFKVLFDNLYAFAPVQ